MNEISVELPFSVNSPDLTKTVSIRCMRAASMNPVARTTRVGVCVVVGECDPFFTSKRLDFWLMDPWREWPWSKRHEVWKMCWMSTRYRLLSTFLQITNWTNIDQTLTITPTPLSEFVWLFSTRRHNISRTEPAIKELNCFRLKISEYSLLHNVNSHYVNELVVGIIRILSEHCLVTTVWIFCAVVCWFIAQTLRFFAIFSIYDLK